MSKSVSTTLEDSDYDALKALAKEQDRDISGQMRHLLRGALREPRTFRVSGTMVPLPDDSTQPGEFSHPASDGSEDGGAGAKGFKDAQQAPLPPEDLGHSPKEPLPG